MNYTTHSSIEHQLHVDNNNQLTLSFSLANFIQKDTTDEDIEKFIIDNITPHLQKSILHYKKSLSDKIIGATNNFSDNTTTNNTTTNNTTNFSQYANNALIDQNNLLMQSKNGLENPQHINYHFYVSTHKNSTENTTKNDSQENTPNSQPQYSPEETVSATSLSSLTNILIKMGLGKKSPFIDTYVFGESRQNYVVNSESWNSPHGKSGSKSYELLLELIETTKINKNLDKEMFIELVANALRKNYI